mgnify:CR=1 FL=1
MWVGGTLKALKIYWKFLNIILTAAATIAVILLILFALGFRPNIVASGSMEPVVHTGAMAFIDTHDTDASVRDIIEYRITQDNGNETYVLHRVIATDESGNYITKGDANDDRDAHPVSKTQIIGKYVFQIPYIGRINARLKNVILGAFAVMYGFTAFLVSYLKDEDNTDEKKKYRL